MDLRSGDAALVACQRERALVVDDEKDIVKLFHLILSTALPNMVVDVARSGLEALQAFDRGHPAVVILDINMGNMQGDQVFDEIQKSCAKRNWRSPAVVFCTGLPPNEAVKRILLSNPAHILLRKPVTGSDILMAVQSRLSPQNGLPFTTARGLR